MARKRLGEALAGLSWRIAATTHIFTDIKRGDALLQGIFVKKGSAAHGAVLGALTAVGIIAEVSSVANGFNAGKFTYLRVQYVEALKVFFYAVDAFLIVAYLQPDAFGTPGIFRVFIPAGSFVLGTQGGTPLLVFKNEALQAVLVRHCPKRPGWVVEGLGSTGTR